MEEATTAAVPPTAWLPAVSLERRRLLIRCRPRTMYTVWAVTFACLAIGIAVLYQNPAWHAKLYVRFKLLVLGWGVFERLGVGDVSKEAIFNRKGLQLPTDKVAGRKPVSMPMGPDTITDYIGESFFRLFHRVDSNDDYYLDPAEFAKLMDKLQPIRSYQPNSEDKAALGDGVTDRMVVLQCEFDPLHLDTITKELKPGVGTNVHYLAGLLNWTRPHRCPLSVPESLLIAGLRPPPDQPLGRPYYVTKPPVDARQSGMWTRDEFDYETAHSLNRYWPPDYARPGARAVQALLAAFHPNAFASTRHQPHSSVALVRAVGPDYVDVAFRLHGEFQLAEPPAHPFWYTPSYWFGHAVFSRNFSRLLLLDLDLPADKKLNIDMEWMQAGMSGAPDETIVEVDIGYSSAMRLCTDNACKKRPKAFGQYEPQQPAPPEQQVSFEQAFDLLEVELYPFKRVPYRPFVDAFREAKLNGGLVHSVVLWGSLDDQSC